jgi:hypothetical protein
MAQLEINYAKKTHNKQIHMFHLGIKGQTMGKSPLTLHFICEVIWTHARLWWILVIVQVTTRFPCDVFQGGNSANMINTGSKKTCNFKNERKGQLLFVTVKWKMCFLCHATVPNNTKLRVILKSVAKTLWHKVSPKFCYKTKTKVCGLKCELSIQHFISTRPDCQSGRLRQHLTKPFHALAKRTRWAM